MAVKEKLIAKDIDGNELQEGDRVQIVELGGRSKLLLNATATIAELKLTSSDTIHCRIKIDSTRTVLYWAAEWLRKLKSEIIERNPLDEFAARITELWAESENAQEVAEQAAYSALDSARLCGEELLKAKKAAGHGNWEKFRSTLIHPRTGNPMPSSTATLYQRIAERWEEIQVSEVRSLRGARELLKSDRQLSAAKQQHTKQTTVLESATVANLDDGFVEAPSNSSEHLEAAPNISIAYGKGVTEEIAQSLAEAGVMPCKPAISPEEFNREMVRSGLIDPQVRIINPKLKQCEFICNGKLKKGTVSGVLFDWKRMTIAAVLIDYDTGQTQVPASNVWLIDEGDIESNDQPINRFAAIDEIEAKGWYWDANRTFCNEPTDYSYWAHITTPDRKRSFFAKAYEALEDALEHCIEQAKEAGVWEEAK